MQNRTEITIPLGKIDYVGRGRRNLAEIEVSLGETEYGKPVFTASGHIWECNRKDIVVGGQCLDTILEYQARLKPPMRDLLNRVHRLWKKHHLNDTHAGTPEQEKALEAIGGASASRYSEQCDYLEKLGLLTVEWEGKPYTYGHGWIYRDIPAVDLAEIRELMGLAG